MTLHGRTEELRNVRIPRIGLLIGCLFGRHEWAKQRGTFGMQQVGPDGRFYESHYCMWCGRGYPCHSIMRKLWIEFTGR